MICRDVGALFLLFVAAAAGVATYLQLPHEDRCTVHIDQAAFDSCMRECHVIQGEPYRFREIPEGHAETLAAFLVKYRVVECSDD